MEEKAQFNVYLPRDYCSQPWLAISRDEGLTWETVQVAKNGMPVNCGFTSCTDPSVAVDVNAGEVLLEPSLAVREPAELDGPRRVPLTEVEGELRERGDP